jgi:predicted FMN-binding regulatory protein PaiB
MFVPKNFRSLRPGYAAELMSEHGWALLVTIADGVPRGSHLPFVYEPAADGEGDGVLLGHMNRANPQWRDLREGGTAMVVFEGPASYVSPTVYQTTPAAPSFNYTAVHAYGTAELIEDREETIELLRRTVDAFERGREPVWDIEPSMDLVRKIVGGVVAFRIPIERLDAAAKLSQNKAPELHDRVLDAFAASDHGHERALAEHMRRERALRAEQQDGEEA